uniref:Cilia and flagella associated protein 68 n=1 Tax=Erpetoichthys calabaricus TaxID=27687 RepID=A0A8C4T2A1_ERPCA
IMTTAQKVSSTYLELQDGGSGLATGHGEVWWHLDDSMKFKQYGWRSGTSEDAYSSQTLIGNWNEEHFSVSSATRSRPMPSQVNTKGITLAHSGHSTTNLKKQVGAFPGHQPQLDPAQVKRTPNSTYQLDYDRKGQGGHGE